MADKTITVYGTTWCGDCIRAKRFLAEQRVRYTWVDIEQQPEAQELVLRLNGGLRIVPTILFPDGSVLVEPTIPALRSHAERFPELVRKRDANAQEHEERSP